MKRTKTELYGVKGMVCAACSASVERVVGRIKGVESVAVNLAAERMKVVYDETLLSEKEITSAVEKAGFSASLFSLEETPEADTTEITGQNVLWAGICSFILLYLSMGQMLIPNLPVPSFLDVHDGAVGLCILEGLLSTAVLIIGESYFRRGYRALFSRAPTMESLVALGSSASYLYSLVLAAVIVRKGGDASGLYFEASATVLTLIMFGKYLEGRSRKKTGSAIAALKKLRPDRVTICVDSDTEEIPLRFLKPGDVALIKQGDSFPADGIILSGECSADESMLTGESLPIEKQPGDKVTGGSICLSGAIRCRITAVGSETTLSRIISLVESAQGEKAPIASAADRIAAIFVPVVLGIAVAASLIWFLCGKELSFVLKIFTGILVVACPCSLGLATPTALLVGTGLGAEHGILIRSGEALQRSSESDVVVFDKTGTLTAGRLELEEVLPLTIEQKEALSLAAALESQSNHPISQAFREIDVSSLPFRVIKIETVSGMGLKGVLSDGREVVLGSRKMMEHAGLQFPVSAKEKEACSEILLAVNGCPAAMFFVSDALRPDAVETVRTLKNMGKEVLMLTGDRPATAETISNALGGISYEANLLPEQKTAIIAKLRSEGKKIIMVGDGINDVPSLAAADVGVAMGSGSDAALETGDVVILQNQTARIPQLLRLSARTMRTIRQNLFWAFFYNLLAIPIAAGVLYPFFGLLINPMICAACMSFSSLFVVTNALRLGRKKI